MWSPRVSRCEWRFFKGLGAVWGSGGEFPESFLRKIFENLEIVFFTIKQCSLLYFLWFYELLLEFFVTLMIFSVLAACFCS